MELFENFLGLGILWEFFGNSLVVFLGNSLESYLNMYGINLSRLWFLSRFFLNGKGRKDKNLDTYK